MAEADYQLTRCDPEFELSAKLWAVFSLNEDRGFSYGLEPGCTVWASSRRPRDQGGRRNHGVDWLTRRTAFQREVDFIPAGAEGVWFFTHFGHSLPIFVNGVATRRQHLLETGDVVRPGTGVEFTFSLPSDLLVLDALVRREGEAILARPEPLIDYLNETLQLDPQRAERWLAAFVARRRAPR
ncbi:MAG: hypothetical protein QM817_08625 [Archangium sp.]